MERRLISETMRAIMQAKRYSHRKVSREPPLKNIHFPEVKKSFSTNLCESFI